MSCFEKIESRGHEQVVFIHDKEAGLKAIVAVHNTILGPGLGGCRVRPYKTEEEALEDVLRLSEGMTYKNSIAGLDLGGGKACIIADPHAVQGEARQKLFASFARNLQRLSGSYITAEDMGTTPADMKVIKANTNYVVGFPIEEGGSGDPSPWTANGVFNSIKTASQEVLGKNLSGLKVAVQGTGHVGMYLIEHLIKAGAEVFACDTNAATLKIAEEKFPKNFKVVGLDEIYSQAVDVFAPCAIGQTVNERTVKDLQCKIICGAANNQLSNNLMYEVLANKGIIYCPDFVVNAGGVTPVGAELRAGGWNKQWVEDKIEKIGQTTVEILKEASKLKLPTEIVALEMAMKRVKENKKS